MPVSRAVQAHNIMTVPLGLARPAQLTTAVRLDTNAPKKFQTGVPELVQIMFVLSVPVNSVIK